MGLTDELEKLVLDGDYDGARNKICTEVHKDIIHAEGMNLVAKLFDVGLRTAFTPEQIAACSEMLNHIVRVMSGKEALISLLEQIEVVDLENKLYLVLEPLRITMDKVPQKWHNNLKWTLEVLSKRLRLTEVPAKVKQETKRLTTDVLKKFEAANGCLKTNIYDPIQGFLNFYEYCVSYCLTHFSDTESQEKMNTCKKILRDHILRLLGHPLIYCPFRYPEEEKDDMTTRSRDKLVKEQEETKAVGLAMAVLELLSKLHTSVSHYHDWIDMKISDESEVIFREKFSASDDDENPEPEDCTVDYLSLGCYYYLVYGKNLNGVHRKSPSSPVREVFVGLFLVSELLEDENVEVQIKALSLSQSLLNQLCPYSPYHRLIPEFLETNVHFNFFRKLSHVFMYSDHQEVRRIGAFVFKSYLWSFNASGRFHFLKHILNSGYPDTLVGFVITQLKEFARQALEKIDGSKTLNCMGQEEPLIPDMDIYFTGKYLRTLVELCMKSTGKSGPTPTIDLMSCDSQVLSTLNLIRFLLIRDGKSNNSGVVDLLSAMNENFLKTVRTSLDLAVMQTKGRLNELKDPGFLEWESKHNNNKCDTVIHDPSGAKLANPQELSADEQAESCKKILSKMDLLECVLAHTNECLDSVGRTTMST